MATNPYSTQTIAGYNTNPPADDGSQVEANKVSWSTHLDKLAKPLKDLAEAINTQVLSAFGVMVITDDPGEETVIIANRIFGA